LLWRAASDGAYRTSQLAFARGGGSVLVAHRAQRIAPNVALIEENTGSANVGKMTAALR
jgi:hypothetical protein